MNLTLFLLSGLHQLTKLILREEMENLSASLCAWCVVFHNRASRCKRMSEWCCQLNRILFKGVIGRGSSLFQDEHDVSAMTHSHICEVPTVAAACRWKQKKRDLGSGALLIPSHTSCGSLSILLKELIKQSYFWLMQLFAIVFTFMFD